MYWKMKMRERAEKEKFCWENYNKKSAPAVDAVGRNVMTRVVSYDTGKILERDE